MKSNSWAILAAGYRTLHVGFWRSTTYECVLQIVPVMAKVKFLCVGILDEVWYKGEKNEKRVKSLNLLDSEPFQGHQMKATMGYTPSAEETKEIDLDKLLMQPIVLGVSDPFTVNNRVNWRGAIDRSSLPKGALIQKAENTQSGQARP